MFKKSKLALAFAALATVTLFSGCLGDSNRKEDTFVCIKTVYDYNTGKISQNKWVNEILFILPGGICYGFASFLDTIIFNSFQFWTGENPLLAKDASGNEYQLEKSESGTVVVTNLSTHQSAEYQVNEDGTATLVAAN